MSMLDYNSQLQTSARITLSSEPNQGHIENPGCFDNRIWQTRQRVPEPFEMDLVAVLEEIFEAGAIEIEEVIAGLNARSAMDRQGQPWTESSFLQEMAVLGK